MYAAYQIFTFLWTSVEVLPPPLTISLFKPCRKIAAEGNICCVLMMAAPSLSKASVAITFCLMTNGKNAHVLLGRSLFYDVYINGSEVSAGLIRLRSTPLPKLQGLEYVLNVTATDDNASGGPHSLTATARVVVGVDDVNNNKPIFEQVRIFAETMPVFGNVLVAPMLLAIYFKNYIEMLHCAQPCGSTGAKGCPL